MATLASYALYLAVQQMPVREVEVNSVPVVVANQDLPVGTLLTVDHVKIVAWPASSPVPGAFATTDDVSDRGLIAGVVENEPLTESKLASREAGGGLPPSIPLGMRALSVRVNEVIGVAGFVVPGTRVDVLATVRLEGQEGGMSKVVVSNVQVLTAGTRYDLERARTGEPMPSTVVTLMVTPEEAERIALAGNEGSLVLTLRNPLDTKPTETEGIRSAQLMGPAPKPPVIVQRRNTRVAVRPSAPEPPKTYTVEAIRAGQRGNEEVR
jgi:pilus assembly protein CpaB